MTQSTVHVIKFYCKHIYICSVKHPHIINAHFINKETLFISRCFRFLFILFQNFVPISLSNNMPCTVASSQSD